MKSILVSVSALVFFLFKNERNVKEDWLVVNDMTISLTISTEETNSTCENFKSFRSGFGKKEYALANKTATLTEEKTV